MAIFEKTYSKLLPKCKKTARKAAGGSHPHTLLACQKKKKSAPPRRPPHWGPWAPQWAPHGAPHGGGPRGGWIFFLVSKKGVGVRASGGFSGLIFAFLNFLLNQFLKK